MKKNETEKKKKLINIEKSSVLVAVEKYLLLFTGNKARLSKQQCFGGMHHYVQNPEVD